MIMPSDCLFLELMFFLRLQAGHGRSPPSAGAAGREFFTCFASFFGRYSLETSIQSTAHPSTC